MNASQPMLVRTRVRDARLPPQFGDAGWMDLEEHERTLEFLRPLNELLGPLTSLNLSGATLFDLPVTLAYATHTDFTHLFKGLETFMQSMTVPTAGKGLNLPWGWMSSLGEGIERVMGVWASMRLHEEGRIVRGSYSALTAKGRRCVHPSKVNVYHPEQYADPAFPFAPLTETMPCGWIEGTALLTGEKVLVPAQVATFGYIQYPGERAFGYNSSAGLASGLSEKDAIVHGLNECIERDAMNVRWAAGVPPARLVDFELTDVLPQLRGCPLLEHPCFEVSAWHYSIDTPGVHVTALHVRHKEFKEFSYYPGGGSSPNVVDSLASSLGEVGQAFRFHVVQSAIKSGSSALPAFLRVEKDSPYDEVDNLFKTVFWYGYKERCDWLHRVFYDRAPRKRFDDVAPQRGRLGTSQKFDLLKRTCAERGWNPVIIDITPSGLRRVKLVKVFVPELSSYYIVYPNHGHQRYYRALVEAGELAAAPRFEDLQRAPLPYP